MKSGGFKIRPVTVNENGWKYRSHQVVGYLDGQRIRRQFKSREEALGEKNRLEVQAANCGDIRAVNTRLSPAQVAEAEVAFARLDGKPLLLAIEHFVTTYRPPTVEITLEAAGAAFLLDRKKTVSAPVLVDYDKLLKRLYRAFPGRLVHTVATVELETLMATMGKTKRSWNNARVYLHSVFEFFAADQRRWCVVNPVKAIIRHDIARTIPHTLSAATLKEMFKFAEGYSGGPRSKLPAGFLAPYLALATFGGVRPGVDYGELRKIHDHPDKSKVIDLPLGVIRVLPELSKTNDLRTTTIQPNLRKWLQKYPLDKFPLIVPDMMQHLSVIRQKFGIRNDTLRHTFVSAHVAKFQSLGATALQAGNSEGVIKKYYLSTMSAADARAFWSIKPSRIARDIQP